MVKKTKGSSGLSEPMAIYQLKVTLDRIRPPIWRRIQVRGDISLFKLHKILQGVMGWYDCHLHQFLIDGESYSIISREADMLGDDFKDEKKFRLDRIIPGEKFKFVYEYDFGDSWSHTILVEKIFKPEEELEHPSCLKGKRSAPPEDCGGEGGYYHLLKALRDRSHPEHEDMLMWMGGKFDPEYFDADMVNERLKKIM